jgi:hypothetical protein
MGKFKNHAEHLKLAIGFTEEDLQANQDRYITKRQRLILNRERSGWRLFCYSAVVLSPILCALALLDGLIAGDPVQSRISIISLICGLTAIFFTYCYLKWQQYDSDLSKGDVAVVEGHVTLRQHQERNGTRYEIRVQSRTFTVSISVFDAFRDGDLYAIYYSPHTKKLLSAEWLPDMDDPFG